MPNVMGALPNIGGALCSTPQSLADTLQYGMVDIQSPAAEVRRGKNRRKKKEERKIEITGKKYNGLPYYIGRP